MCAECVLGRLKRHSLSTYSSSQLPATVIVPLLVYLLLLFYYYCYYFYGFDIAISVVIITYC